MSVFSFVLYEKDLSERKKAEEGTMMRENMFPFFARRSCARRKSFFLFKTQLNNVQHKAHATTRPWCVHKKSETY
jgi:hypothetical protein